MSFCQNCGCRVNDTAKFCSSCGCAIPATKNETSGGEKNTVESMHDKKQSGCAKIGKFMSLVEWMWIAIAVGFIETVFDCFDAVCYYDLGQTWTFIVGIVGVAFEMLLVIGIKNCYSWARKSYIVCNLFLAAFAIYSLVNSVEGVKYVAVIISAICAIVLLGKDMRTLCNKRDFHHHAVCWWMAVVACAVAYVLIYDAHFGSDEWLEDCGDAVRSGSNIASTELIAFLSDDDNEEHVTDAEAIAFVNALAEEGVNHDTGESDVKTSSGNSSRWINSVFKILALIIAVAFSSLKKRFSRKE